MVRPDWTEETAVILYTEETIPYTASVCFRYNSSYRSRQPCGGSRVLLSHNEGVLYCLSSYTDRSEWDDDDDDDDDDVYFRLMGPPEGYEDVLS